jgi:hypothetical protein
LWSDNHNDKADIEARVNELADEIGLHPNAVRELIYKTKPGETLYLVPGPADAATAEAFE